MDHLLNSIPIYFSISAFHSEIRGVCFRNNTREIPPFKLTIPLTSCPNPCPVPHLAVMTRLFAVRDTINVHWRVLALFGVFIDYSISRPEATHQQQHITQDNNTNLLWKKSQVDAQWRCRGLRSPASRYILDQPVFQFYFKIQNVFFLFCFFPSFAFVVLILVLFVCVCIRFALISSGIGLSHRCSPTPTPTASPSPSPEELHHRHRYRHHPIFKVFVSINSARKRVCPGT